MQSLGRGQVHGVKLRVDLNCGPHQPLSKVRGQWAVLGGVVRGGREWWVGGGVVVKVCFQERVQDEHQLLRTKTAYKNKIC